MRATAFLTTLVADGLPSARSAGEKIEPRKTTANAARSKPCTGPRPVAPLVPVAERATKNTAIRDLLEIVLGWPSRATFEGGNAVLPGQLRQTEPILPRVFAIVP